MYFSKRQQRTQPLPGWLRQFGRLLLYPGLPFTGFLQNLLDIYVGRHKAKRSTQLDLQVARKRLWSAK